MRNLGAGVAALVLSAVLAAAPVGAASVYTSFWALGDSLTDDGNLSEATGGLVPGAPYVDGRYSNGPVWADHVAADFAKRGLATQNFAYGGAAVGPNAPPVRNLGQQVGDFASASAGRLGARPVASLWFGANDLIGFGIPNGVAREVGRAAADGVAQGALALRGLGVNDVALFNLPGLHATPLYRQTELATEAKRGVGAFNRRLDRRADELRALGMNVIEVDAFGLFGQLLDDPARFGVADTETPCYVPGAVPCDLETEAPLLAFFDAIHPNATVHGALADVVRGDVAPVPLPAPAALLLFALGGLAVAARRRRLGQAGSRIA